MEPTILAMLGIIITLMLYLDRGHRADNAKVRQEMNDGNTQIRQEMTDGFKAVRAENAQLRQDMNDGNAQLRQDMNDGFKQVHSRLDKLTDIVMDLCRRVGRLEGRIEASETKPDTAP